MVLRNRRVNGELMRMNTPRPPLLSQSPDAELPLGPPARSRQTQWWLATAGGVARMGLGWGVGLVFRSAPAPARPVPLAHSEPMQCWIQFGKEVKQEGLVSVGQQNDGVTEPSLAGGLECHVLRKSPGVPELYAYFRIEPPLQELPTHFVVIEVEYFDADAGGHFRLDYDSLDQSKRLVSAYWRSKELVYLKGTQRWRKARFLIDDARFEGRQNDRSDFRVAVTGTRLFLRSVRVLLE